MPEIASHVSYLMRLTRHCAAMQLTGLLKTPAMGSTRRISLSNADRRRHQLNSALLQLASWTSFMMVCMQPLAGHVGVLGGLQPVPCMAGQCDLDRPMQQLQQPPVRDALSMQHDQPISERQISGNDCIFPCNKSCTAQPKEPCKFGVTAIKDGCDCCIMCARQQGDMCSYRDKCDESKGLYCDMKLDGQQRGICRSRSGKHCNAFGKTYKDGEEFKPNCSQLCTCQDGRYACSSLCPQEFRPPSSAHCRDAQLVAISSRCCREWVCPHSHSLLGPDDSFPNEPPSATERERCKIETTQWSSCSTTCGLGMSLRMTRMTEDKNCQPVTERRLCIIRPCPDSGLLTDSRPHPQPPGKDVCRPTWKDKVKQRIQWGKCESVDEYQLKYCASCKKQQCCAPSKTRDRPIKFKCPTQTELQEEKMMFIVTCECYKPENCPLR